MSATKIYNFNLKVALTYRERELKRNNMHNFFLKNFLNFNKSKIFNHFLKEGYKRPIIYTTINRLPITQSIQDRKKNWLKRCLDEAAD
jgi:hypothetical protein